jgi:hypothetical protein
VAARFEARQPLEIGTGDIGRRLAFVEAVFAFGDETVTAVTPSRLPRRSAATRERAPAFAEALRNSV